MPRGQFSGRARLRSTGSLHRLVVVTAHVPAQMEIKGVKGMGILQNGGLAPVRSEQKTE